jgi:hypothetical protein
VRPVELAQRNRAIGEKRGIVRDNRQRPIVSGNRTGGTIEFQERIAAIAERIERCRLGSKRMLETCERFIATSKLEQNHAALVQQFGIVRRETSTSVKLVSASLSRRR